MFKNVSPKCFQKLDQFSQGVKDGQPRSSRYYWRYNMQRAIKKKAETLHAEAELLEWKPIGSEARYVGTWIVTRVLKYAAIHKEGIEKYLSFQQVTRQIGQRSKKTFIVFSNEADKDGNPYADSHKRFIQSDQPVLCPPANADQDFYGHLLLGQILAIPSEHKGQLQISKDMLIISIGCRVFLTRSIPLCCQ